MKKYCIDTNALLSFLTDRNINQQKTVEKYLERAIRGELSLIVIENVITELVYVMQSVYRTPKNIISQTLKALEENPGISIDGHFNLKTLRQIWPDPVNDYGDALIVLYALEKNCEILTFDKKLLNSFKKLKA
ncbi:MAG TPA: PIN domain-containing protein [Spirochaetota bacterium]|nr:PIN domain-containing protein [Spirochaetota bacterium]HRZ26961.1 PIN domain-containing protein [Spirochaetota bacterium]HSA15978.1 PIN domain-containing protein [Spirochaetota bacterium]